MGNDVIPVVRRGDTAKAGYMFACLASDIRHSVDKSSLPFSVRGPVDAFQCLGGANSTAAVLLLMTCALLRAGGNSSGGTTVNGSRVVVAVKVRILLSATYSDAVFTRHLPRRQID